MLLATDPQMPPGVEIDCSEFDTSRRRSERNLDFGFARRHRCKASHLENPERMCSICCLSKAAKKAKLDFGLIVSC